MRKDITPTPVKMASMLSFSLYLIVTLAVLLIGGVYAARKTVMPYHLAALETTWEEIDPKTQFMLKALLNGGGYFGLCAGFFMLILLLIPLRAGELWAGYAIGFIGLVGTAPLGLIVYRVKTQTSGNPPLFVMVILNFLLLLGLIAFALGQ